MKKQKTKERHTLKGELVLYFATGESSRPQVIGLKGMDKKGRINNFNYVWDVKPGDSIEFINNNKLRPVKLLVGEDVYGFLFFLAYLWDSKNKLYVKYTPSKDNKSWGETIK